MVPALALSKLGLLKLLGILLLFLHGRIILYTHQSSHKRAIHASKQAIIYALRRNFRNKNHLIGVKT